jgi:acetyl-CoA carboxylase carboxyl transferase subunit beta
MALERFFRRRGPQREQSNEDLPDLWSKCPNCNTQIYNKNLEANQRVCTSCGHHHRLPVRKRIDGLVDPGSFELTSGKIRSVDALEFTDTEPYVKRLERAKAKTGRENAIFAGRARIAGLPVVVAVMDFEFSGGSLGSAEGEEISRAAELAALEDRAFIMVCASGGARMQESALSLMQLAKTTVALEGLTRKRLPYITILTDPTTGGVTASYATIADIIIAEPGALIGFAGARVIQQTIRQNLPEGFQRAEFLEAHGMIDMVVSRLEHRERLAHILAMLMRQPTPNLENPAPVPIEPPRRGFFNLPRGRR